MTSIERMRETERGELHFKEPLKLAALGRLTGVVAHEFNKLLAVVIGNLDQIRTRSRDGEARQRASAAVVAAAHGARLIQSLLDFASSEPRDHRVSDLNTVIAEMKPLLCQILGPRIGLEFGLASASLRLGMFSSITGYRNPEGRNFSPAHLVTAATASRPYP